MKKILVIHGLGGGKGSGAEKAIRKHISDVVVYGPEVPIDPYLAATAVQRFNDEFKPDLIVGTSMGGFYTMTIKTKATKLLINPAMDIAWDIKFGILKDNISLTQEYTKDRENGEKTYVINDEFINKLKKIYYDFVRCNPIIDDRNRIYGIFGTNDELFHHAEDYKYAYNDNYKMIPTGHHLSADEQEKYVIPVVEHILSTL